MNNKQLLRDT